MQHRTDEDETCVDAIDVIEIAAKLRRDPRTVRKVMAGGRVRGRIAQAEIEREIAARRARRNASQ